jgi:ornithine carbamoyltransferase
VAQLAEHARVPVINGLSDREHPCQTLADLLTVYERFGGFKGITLAWVGDGNNVCHSLLLGAAQVGLSVRAATPPGHAPDPEIVRRAQEQARASGATLTLTMDPGEAVRGADVIYTDVWASMGQEDERAQRASLFQPYQVNTALLRQARPEAVVMHCLPAHRGEEITDEVLDGPQAIVFDQAENRLHAQKALLAMIM